MAEFNVLDASGNPVEIGSFWLPTIVKGAFTPGAGYADGRCIGGLFAVNLGVAAETFSLQLVSLALLGMTAGIGVDLLVFDANPTTSTLTDGVAAAIVSADLPKLVYRGSVPAQFNNFAGTVPMTFDGFPRRMVVTDGAAHIYIAFVSQGGLALTAPAGEWRVEVRN